MGNCINKRPAITCTPVEPPVFVSKQNNVNIDVLSPISLFSFSSVPIVKRLSFSSRSRASTPTAHNHMPLAVYNKEKECLLTQSNIYAIEESWKVVMNISVLSAGRNEKLSPQTMFYSEFYERLFKFDPEIEECMPKDIKVRSGIMATLIKLIIRTGTSPKNKKLVEDVIYFAVGLNEMGFDIKWHCAMCTSVIETLQSRFGDGFDELQPVWLKAMTMFYRIVIPISNARWKKSDVKTLLLFL